MATTEGVTLTDLRTEIERLSRELDLASTEKIQSAQYGLALLEEKSALEQRCNDLEGLYENTKHELDITQEVSSTFLPYPLNALSSTLILPCVFNPTTDTNFSLPLLIYYYSGNIRIIRKSLT